MRMPINGATPTRVSQRKDGYWYSYSPDGKYIAMVVADMNNAVVSTARLAAKATGTKMAVEGGAAPDALASSSGTLHPATPRWVEILDAQTFQTLHKLEGVAGIEEYFYWSPRSRYIVTWQPLAVPASNSIGATPVSGTSPVSGPSPATTTTNTSAATSPPPSSSNMVNIDGPNLKVWDVLTGKVVMHFKHGQRQGWPIVRWTDDEKVAARWASGQIHLYHWAKASFHLSPEENFSAMTRETIDKQNVWDWSVARSALAIFTKENSANNTPANVHLYPLNTSLGEDPSKAETNGDFTDASSPNDASSNNNNNASNTSSNASSAPSTPAKKSGANTTATPQSNQGKKNKGGQQQKGGGKNQLPPLNSAPPKEPNLGVIIEPAGVAPKSKQTAAAPAAAASSSPSESDDNNNASSAETPQKPKPTPINLLTTLAPAEPVSSKSFYNCDDVAFHWHNRGQALLVFATTQRDQSGANNYYGNTYLYYLPADGKGECDVTTDKKGPIHDVRWNAKGNDFAVTYGEYPSKTALYNRKCKALGHLGTESRNKIVWSPQGRVLMSGGFGQLPGNFDIWDTVSLAKLGSAQSFTSAQHEWSPDGKFLLSAALWPRMRVDNFFSLYDLKANLIHHERLSEVWKIGWRPMPGCASAYPTSPQDPIVVAAPAQIASISTRAATSGRPTASSEPYRPPGAKRAANSQFAQSQVPLKEAKVAPERFAPPNAKPTAVAAPTPVAAPSKVPVGGTPVGGVPKKSNSPSGGAPRTNNRSPAGNNRNSSGRY